MSNLGELKATIAAKLIRTDQTANIAIEIPRAIRYYRNRRFYFNEDTRAFNTVASQDYLDCPGLVSPFRREGSRGTDGVRLPVQGSYLCAAKLQDIVDSQLIAGTNASQPTDYAMKKLDQMALYPIPDKVYLVSITGLYDVTPALTSASDAADTNDWITEAYGLIEGRVIQVIGRDYLEDEALERKGQNLQVEWMDILKRETDKRSATGRLRAH